MATPQRSRVAILSGAKKVIAEVGSYESNMLDIAEQAQVARATVYNHFSDKEEMLVTLVESEISRLEGLALAAESPVAALYTLSREISVDPALRKMVVTDPLDIARFVTITNHPLWRQVTTAMTNVFGPDSSSLIVHWLIGQIASPLSAEESAQQASQLASVIA
ncbi:MAG: helix-turn-helix domain-containing protein [Actinomycetes bacterium]